MTSFMQTMFVVPSLPPSPSRLAHNQHTYHPHPASPLKPIQSNILAASESCIPFAWPDAPASTYESPLHRQFRSVLALSALSEPIGGKDLFSNYGRPPPVLPQPSHSHSRSRNEEANSNSPYSNANARTRAAFKPARTQKGTNSWQLKQFAEATLGSGSLKKVVKLPHGEDKDEWLAVNVVDFYNQINLLYGAITEFCSPQSCPEMKATDEFEYLWHHPPDFPKPTRLPAPTYISHLLSWVSALLADTTLFPTQPGVPFPSNFQSSIKQIFKRLYRIYAHIYCHHYGVIRGLGLEAHLNTGFKHYVLFVEEFGLADEGAKARSEWFGPLGDLVESMLRSD